MPFEVFRRHQRKLLATFAIMAMFAFVVADSLPRLLSPAVAARDEKLVELYGKPVYRSQLNELARQRYRVNLFVSSMAQFMPREPFGGLKTRDLVDAWILEREADRLGIPATPEMGREWLRQVTGGRMNRELFYTLYAPFSNEISEEELLADIANQVRLINVRRLLGSPLVTPYDVFRNYQGQNEKVAAKLVEIPVDAFLDQVPEPSDGQLRAFYDQFKNALPDPASVNPGFKIPRQIQVEILSIDGNALARGLRETLTDSELRAYYENHKSEFEVPSELPTDLFAGQPELTPPLVQPFSEVRSILAPRLAEEKAQAQIVEKFGRIRDEVMIPFADEYLRALDELEDARKHGDLRTEVSLPTPPSLKDIAAKEGLNHELTPLLSREDAEKYGQIATAEVGLNPLSGGRRFAAEFFDPRTSLFEPVEFADALGTRFLARKVKDVEPRVPPFEEVRSEVALAWKRSQARPLAEKAARDLAARLKEQGGKLGPGPYEGFRVLSIPPITRQQSSFLPASLFDPGPPVETPIPEVPLAGEDFRDTYFGLTEGAVEVAANQPQTVFYLLTLDRREPASFTALYAPTGDEFRYKSIARDQAARQLDEQWMSWLRRQAGLPPNWVPPDEADREATTQS